MPREPEGEDEDGGEAGHHGHDVEAAGLVSDVVGESSADETASISIKI